MKASEGSTGRVDFVIERGNLRNCKFVEAPDGDAVELRSGQVLVRVSAFAFTANNVTYGVAGDMMGYWSFFPAEPGWGRIPVWGFADVIRSAHAGVAEGERIFGYLPMSTHLVLEPGNIGPGGFVDASPHRAALPAVYNQYSRVAADPGYGAEHEDEQMLFRPLFMTAFLLDDFLAESGFFGARAVILSSASSKTAFGLAFLLHRRARCEVVGLTSPGNVPFVESLGCYDRVVTYDHIDSLASDLPVAFVDMAGNGAVTAALHRRFGERMKHSSVVGLTHWERREPPSDLPGAPPTFFFAPTQLEKRTREWGPHGLQTRYADAWREFASSAARRIRAVHGRGRAAVERVYLDTLEGRVRPEEGHILSLL
jgi:hypothetical protein